MTTALRLCCGREPKAQQALVAHDGYQADKGAWVGYSTRWRIHCTKHNCLASTAWHATAEGAQAEWNGREKKND